MQEKLRTPYIELRINRDFGDIITVYFEFLRNNLKKFTNVFLSYNGIFLVGLLVVSYLFVSGIIGLIAVGENGYNGEGTVDETNYWLYLGVGGVLFILIFLAVAVMNYSLAGSYMIKYESTKGDDFDKKEVWRLFVQKLGSIFLFILFLIILYIGISIVGIILAIVPILGILAYYVLMFFMIAWFGVSFFVLLQEDKGIVDSFGEGWKLVSQNFWKSVGVNFILGLLNGILFLVVFMVPGILIGIYSYHVVENDVNVATSFLPTVIYTIGTSAILIIMVYSQSLSQFVNGILYFALHEKTYNTNTRSKIDEIGNTEL
ncbi:MAG: hypothetical protein V7724_13585 [Sediminicola sp.]